MTRRIHGEAKVANIATPEDVAAIEALRV